MALQHTNDQFLFQFQQSYLSLLVVNPTKSAQGMRLAILATVSIHVSPQTHAAPMQPVLWRTTRLNASVHLALQGTLSDAVCKVSQQYLMADI